MLTSHARSGTLSEEPPTKKRPDPIVTPVYLVGRSATSGQAIRKILPPDVPKIVLIGLPTRVAAAGVPHYTTINSMWSRTPWSCGKSARCGQAIYPETFAPYVPKIVLRSWPPVSRRQRGTAPSSPTELPHEVVFSRPAGSRPTHLHRAIPEVSHVCIHIYTMVTFRMSWHTLSCPRHCHPPGMAKGSPGQLRI